MSDSKVPRSKKSRAKKARSGQPDSKGSRQLARVVAQKITEKVALKTSRVFQGARQSRTLLVARAIGRVTFLEIVRDKILYNILACALLLLAVGLLASRLSAFSQLRVLLDFGMSALGLSSVMVAIFAGAAMIGREYERRTVYVALSRPITRFQFVLGKFFGLVAVLTVNWFLLCVSFSLILGLASGGPEGSPFSSTLLYGLLLLLLQSIVAGCIALFFSTFTTTSLSVIITLGLYLVGNSISSIRLVATRVEDTFARGLLNAAATVLPCFEYFNLGTQVTYGLPVGWAFGVTAFFYSILLIALFLALSGWLIQRKEA